MLFLILLLCPCVFFFINAANITGKIDLEAAVTLDHVDNDLHSNVKKNTMSLPSLHVMLNGGAYTTLSRSDGRFTFLNIPPGRYVLDIISTTYMFSQYKIDISEATEEAVVAGKNTDEIIRVLEYRYPGAEKTVANYPLWIQPHLKLSYFLKREKFNFVRMIFQNPSMLMMGVMALMAFALPKMMANMDPEERKKMQDDMKGANNPNEMMKGFFGGGAKDEDDDEDDD